MRPPQTYRSLFVSSGFVGGAAGALKLARDSGGCAGLWLVSGPGVTSSEVPGARVSPAALDVRVVP